MRLLVGACLLAVSLREARASTLTNSLLCHRKGLRETVEGLLSVNFLVEGLKSEISTVAACGSLGTYDVESGSPEPTPKCSVQVSL